MRNRFLVAAALVISCGLSARPVAAQSDILLQLRSGSPLGDRVRVDSAGGFVALGHLGIGIIPATGPGLRMMWHPFKGAFRAGNAGPTGTPWNDNNIGFYSWAGGNETVASAFGTFAFGDQVTVSGVSAAGLGSSNTVSGTAGFSAGASNLCSGFACTAVGFTSTATGQGAIAIGYRTTANADYAVALGHRASANGRTGSFTWADASTTDSLRSNANNSFQIRAAGGVRLHTNATMTTGVSLSAGGSSWNVISDRNRKRDFESIDGESLLARIREIPVSTWRYVDEEDRSVRHIGPMAQDWHAAFGFSGDDQTINMSDFDGVNFAAVKALDARSRQQQEEIAALRGQNERLLGAVHSLEERVARLEALLQSQR